MDTEEQSVTRTQYARSRKITPQYLGRLIKSGRIPVNSDGTVNPRMVDAARVRTVAPRVKPERDSYYQSRALRERYTAKMAKLEYEQATGRLVDADIVLEKVTQAFTNTRIRMRSVGRSLAPLLEHRNVGEIEKLLNEAIDNALESLSEDVLRPADATRATDDSEPHPLLN